MGANSFLLELTPNIEMGGKNENKRVASLELSVPIHLNAFPCFNMLNQPRLFHFIWKGFVFVLFSCRKQSRTPTFCKLHLLPSHSLQKFKNFTTENFFTTRFRLDLCIFGGFS